MSIETNEFKTISKGNLSLDIYNATEDSFGVASVIISGNTDALLVDAQFTLAHAERVAARIKDSGKKLTAIYVSHGDPDFYFGLEVFKKYFPGVTAYATPATVEHIKATAQKKLQVWGGQLGNKITSNAILPQVIQTDTLELEGQQIQIIGLTEFPSRTFLWIPSIKAVVGGINIFGVSFHLWMADAQSTAARNEWIGILAQIEALRPDVVVPAHGTNNGPFNLEAVIHTKNYVSFYEEALKQHTGSSALIESIKRQYPRLAFETALNIGAKVNTGEMPW